MPGDEECTANRDRSRLTSVEPHCGQTTGTPLRTSSSNVSSQSLQVNS